MAETRVCNVHAHSQAAYSFHSPLGGSRPILEVGEAVIVVVREAFPAFPPVLVKSPPGAGAPPERTL